jgi:glyoxylase-like metal-dependent hydrolase (beta-lactamase superfamily II)
MSGIVLETFASGPVETNVYILGCPLTKEACIIDAPLGCTKKVLDKVAYHGLTVSRILLTHSHLDHIADVFSLKKALQVPVWVHPKDAPNLKAPGADGLPLFLPAEPVSPDGLFVDNEEFFIGKLQIRVLPTPGHTPGGVCFYLPEEGILFSGDTLFQGTMGRIDFPHSEPIKMWRSLKFLSALPPSTKVFPGHGPSTTIGSESWIKEAEKRFGDD